MNNKDLAFVFILSTMGLVFVAFKLITKVLFEWYIAYIALAVTACCYLAKFICTLV